MSARLLSLLLLLGLFSASSAGEGRTSWSGTYRYFFHAGTFAGGSPMNIFYTLTVDGTVGTGTATLAAEGYQSDETLGCDTKVTGSRLDVFFRSFANGSTSNQYGVELYKPGTLLLSLEWAGSGAKRKLLTRWGAYATDAPKPTNGSGPVSSRFPSAAG